MEDEEIEAIDKLANKFDLSRSQFLRNLVLVGLDEAKVLNGIGILQIAKVAKEVKRKFLNDIVSGKLSLNDEGDWKLNK